MKAVGFHALNNAWLLALVLPLVLFYFLKLRRPRLEIPSLFLWRQVLNDRRVNSPFQRFKRNLLLLLQMLLLLLLIAGAMQPFWRGKAAHVRRIPILIDCSASMAALDKPGGASRLGAAKAKVRQIIDGLLPDQELCLISFDRTARRRSGFTNNKRSLREVLDQVQAEGIPSDIEDALRMTQGLAQATAFDEVLLFSDGNFPIRAHFDLSFALDYQRLPPAGPNFGITSLNGRRTAEGDWDVFALIEGSAEAEGSVAVELSSDGDVIAREHVSLEKGKDRPVIFRVKGDEPAALKLNLVPTSFDSLSSDNTAFLQLPAMRPLQVYAPSTLPAYRHAVSALPGVNLCSENDVNLPAFTCDLVVSDRREDLAIQARTCCYVGLIPDDLQGLVSVPQEGATVVDWSRSSQLLQHVELADLLILDQPRFAEGVGESDLESRGYEVIAHGERGPLVLQKREADKLLFYFLFHTDRSTLPYRVGFPVMAANLVQTAMDRAGLSDVQSVRTGVLPDIPLTPDHAYEVESPDGRATTVRSSQTGLLCGIPARSAGWYRISDNGREQARLGASLLAASETSLTSTEEIQFDEDLSVAASSAGPQTDRALWPLLALLAFCALLGEWWYFHKRPGGYPR